MWSLVRHQPDVTVIRSAAVSPRCFRRLLLQRDALLDTISYLLDIQTIFGRTWQHFLFDADNVRL